LKLTNMVLYHRQLKMQSSIFITQ